MRLPPNSPHNLATLPPVLTGQTRGRGSVHSNGQQQGMLGTGSQGPIRPWQNSTITRLWKSRLGEVKGQIQGHTACSAKIQDRSILRQTWGLSTVPMRWE